MSSCRKRKQTAAAPLKTQRPEMRSSKWAWPELAGRPPCSWPSVAVLPHYSSLAGHVPRGRGPTLQEQHRACSWLKEKCFSSTVSVANGRARCPVTAQDTRDSVLLV